MLRKIIVLIVLLQSLGTLFAQTENLDKKHEHALYSLFVNVVPNNFKFPLVGFINIAQGNHNYPQIGFVNATLGSYKTAQVGFVNTNFKTTQGVQVGFVNISKETTKGVQIGFFNYSDTVEGVPIAFLSIVRKGGYRAFEVSTNSLSYINFSFKIGVPKFYTIFQLSYNPNFTHKIASSIGIGSLIPLGGKFYFNPESLQTIVTLKKHIQSLNLNVGYNIFDNFQLSIGPSVAFLYQISENYSRFSIKTFELNTHSNLLIGGNFAVNYRF